MNGKMEGKGRYEMNNGAIYEGEYKEGIREGKGKYQWSNGITFEGNFEKGKPKGKGKLKVGDIEYDVIFEQGKLKDEYKYILKGTIQLYTSVLCFSLEKEQYKYIHLKIPVLYNQFNYIITEIYIIIRFKLNIQKMPKKFGVNTK